MGDNDESPGKAAEPGGMPDAAGSQRSAVGARMAVVGAEIARHRDQKNSNESNDSRLLRSCIRKNLKLLETEFCPTVGIRDGFLPYGWKLETKSVSRSFGFLGRESGRVGFRFVRGWKYYFVLSKKFEKERLISVGG